MFVVVRKSDISTRKEIKNESIEQSIQDPTSNISLAFLEEQDYYVKTITEYNRVYYIYSGKMYLNIGGREIFLQKGDACFVEKGTPYEIKGTFNALAVHKIAQVE